MNNYLVYLETNDCIEHNSYNCGLCKTKQLYYDYNFLSCTINGEEAETKL